MVRLVTLFTALLLPLAAAAQTNAPFVVTLPAGFAPFTKSTQTTEAKEGGKIETSNWVSKSTGGEAVIVSVSKMPGKILDPEKMMASTRDGLLKSLNATLDSEEKVAGDPPASRLLLHSAAAWVRVRLIVSGDTLYQLVYVGHSAEQRDMPVVAEMFDSFKTS